MNIVYPVGEGIYVNLTNRCPCACVFCVRQGTASIAGSGSLWLEREPSVEEVCAALAATDLGRYRELVFCGFGEPTERLDALLAVAAWVRQTHPALPIRVNTNGLADLINGAPTAERFRGLVDAFSISLNAADPEAYLALSRPKFGRAAHPALLAFAQAVRAFAAVTLSVVASPDFTSAQEAAARALCQALDLPLRVRKFIEG